LQLLRSRVGDSLLLEVGLRERHAMLTLPYPIFPVGDVKLVLALPEDSFTAVPSRSPVTSDFALSSEPATERISDQALRLRHSVSGDDSSALAVNSRAS